MRWLGAWAFYIAGDLWYRAFEWSFSDTGTGWRMFQIEQGLFAMSDAIQGPTANGPWSASASGE